MKPEASLTHSVIYRMLLLRKRNEVVIILYPLKAGTLLNGSPAHCRAPFEHVGVQNRTNLDILNVGLNSQAPDQTFKLKHPSAAFFPLYLDCMAQEHPMCLSHLLK